MASCWIWESGCKGDTYAAWVQAIGAILALIIVIAIEVRHNRREIAKLRSEHRSKRIGQLSAVIFLAASMRELLTNMPALYDPALNDKPGLTEACGDLLEEMRRHTSDEMHDNERAAYFAVRRLFSEIFGQVHFGNVRVFRDDHILRLSSSEQQFKKYLENAQQE